MSSNVKLEFSVPHKDIMLINNCSITVGRLKHYRFHVRTQCMYTLFLIVLKGKESRTLILWMNIIRIFMRT